MSLLRVLIAITCGVILGAFVTYSWLGNPNYWPMGALVGGLIAWVAHSPVSFFQGFLQAGEKTWRQMTTVRPPKEKIIVTALERQHYFWGSAAFVSAVSTILGGTFVLYRLFSDDKDWIFNDNWYFEHFVTYLVMMLVVTVGASVRVVFPLVDKDSLWSLREVDLRANPDNLSVEERTSMLKIVALKGNVVVFPLVLAWLVLGKILPAIVYFVVRGLWLLLKNTYLFTVSDGRITSLMGATIGLTAAAALGHNPGLGLAVGLFVGIVLWASRTLVPIRSK